MAKASVRRGPGRQQSQAPDLEAIDGASSETVERQAYRSIRRALMSGRVAPGMPITGRSLAQVLKVSVQPVRDALKRLEADGVLEGRPQSGFFVVSLTQQEYRELTEIRQRLEGLAGRLASATIDKRTLQRLERINEKMARHQSSRDALAENYRFHFTIYEKANRPNLLALIENFWVRIGPALHHHPHKITSSATFERHRQIIKALEERDGDAAEAAIANDLGTAADVIVPRLPESKENRPA